MKTRTKRLFSVLLLALLVLAVYAGSALAQDNSGTATPTAAPSTVLTMREQMLARLGQAEFDQMVARMTAIHGAAATAEMLAKTADMADCPMCNGDSAGMGMMQPGMMQQDTMGQGRGMMGHRSTMPQGSMGNPMDGQNMRGPGMMRGSWMSENSWLPDWAQQGLHDFMGWGMDHFGSHGAANHHRN